MFYGDEGKRSLMSEMEVHLTNLTLVTFHGLASEENCSTREIRLLCWFVEPVPSGGFCEPYLGVVINKALYQSELN
jgi:hypothetical protein